MASVQTIELKLDVTAAASLGEPAYQAATVVLPPASQLPQSPIICFARPGVQYNRLYYTLNLPGQGPGSQANYHASQGWIFVAIDYLGAGNSSSNHDGMKLNYTTVARANQDAETQVLQKLADGVLLPDYPKISNPVKLGVGQSMGGLLTIVQAGRYACYDGVAIIGSSAVHTHPPTRPGDPPIVAPWLAQLTSPDEPPIMLNAKAVEKFQREKPKGSKSAAALAWCFHFDDVDPAIVAEDSQRYDRDVGDASETDRAKEVKVPDWGCLNTPAATAMVSVTPGVVAPEAAAITCPVLVAMGERDVIPDPKGEPRAYVSATSVDLCIVPKMGHMHNFAGTRELLWKRIATWGEWVREAKDWESSSVTPAPIPVG